MRSSSARVLALAALAAGAFAEEPGPRIAEPIAVDGGRIDGGEESPMGGVRTWKGIPFASAERWRPPEAPKPWAGVLTCDTTGPACPQPASALVLPPQIGAQSEDCLRLNVWTPARRVTDRRPVFVWVHGASGGFSRGSGSEAIYEGEFLAKRGIVVVTFDHRLGAFGWLATKEGANWGLLDQIAALEWVKRNIGQFGGDPANVTLAGGGGGAACVAALLVCPRAKGLFHKAILQGAGPRWLRRTRAEGAAQGEAFVKALGSALEEARRRPAEDVLAAAGKREGPFGAGDEWGPVVDGELIPDDPWRLWRDGKEADVPLIAGGNADAGSMFAAPPGVVDVWQYRDWVKATFPGDAAAVTAAFSPRLRDDVPATLAQLASDALAVEPARFAAAAHASRSRKAFLYFFSRITPGAEARHLGAHDGAEVAFTFGSMIGPVGHDQDDQRFARQICDLWANFVKTGDPNADPAAPEWPAYDPKTDEWLEIGADLRVTKNVRKARLDALAAAREKEEAK